MVRSTNWCKIDIPSSLLYKTHLSRQWNCWSLRCSWSIAYRRCSNYISILNLTPCFNGLDKDDCKTRWESFKYWNLARLILDTLRYFHQKCVWFTISIFHIQEDAPQSKFHYLALTPPNKTEFAEFRGDLTHLPLDNMQHERHSADDLYRCIFVNEGFCILIQKSLQFVPKCPIDNWYTVFV